MNWIKKALGALFGPLGRGIARPEDAAKEEAKREAARRGEQDTTRDER